MDDIEWLVPPLVGSTRLNTYESSGIVMTEKS